MKMKHKKKKSFKHAAKTGQTHRMEIPRERRKRQSPMVSKDWGESETPTEIVEEVEELILGQS